MASTGRAFLPRLADALHRTVTLGLVGGTLYTAFFMVDMGYHQIQEVKQVNARIKAGEDPKKIADELQQSRRRSTNAAAPNTAETKA